jgi:hypothetical protein
MGCVKIVDEARWCVDPQLARCAVRQRRASIQIADGEHRLLVDRRAAAA